MAIVVNAAAAPKIVAYRHKNMGAIYIPKSRKDGGGYYSPTTGSFCSADMGGVKAWNDERYPEGMARFEPLYEGTTITVTKEIVL